MFLHSVIVLIVLAHVSVGLRQCDSCVLVDKCSDAVKLASKEKTEETAEKFRRALCRQDGDSYMICCEDFESNIEPTSRFSTQNTDMAHPNLRLLPELCGDIDGQRIVGGDVAGLYEFPWMALIVYRTRFGYKSDCAGTLINEQYVLTAAHCTQGKRIELIRLGEYDTTRKSDCLNDVCEEHLQDIAIEEIIEHDGYEKKPHFNNDIALIRLAERADITYKNVAPICLPTSDFLQHYNIQGLYGTVAGWGSTEDSRTSPVLRKVTIPIATTEFCRGYHNLGMHEKPYRPWTKLCAGEKDRDSCTGDSGGPLMIEQNHNRAKRMIQYGIVSYGPTYCGSHSPGVYTDISKYITWILDHIRS